MEEIQQEKENSLKSISCCSFVLIIFLLLSAFFLMEYSPQNNEMDILCIQFRHLKDEQRFRKSLSRLRNKPISISMWVHILQEKYSMNYFELTIGRNAFVTFFSISSILHLHSFLFSFRLPLALHLSIRCNIVWHFIVIFEEFSLCSSSCSVGCVTYHHQHRLPSPSALTGYLTLKTSRFHSVSFKLSGIVQTGCRFVLIVIAHNLLNII